MVKRFQNICHSDRTRQEVRRTSTNDTTALSWTSYTENLPDLPGDKKTCEEAEAVLENYFAPKRNVVSERYCFRCRAQRRDEPIDCYVTALRELAKSCEFNELESEMIQDQIVEKCYSKKLKERLLQQDTLDLNKAVRMAKTTESAEHARSPADNWDERKLHNIESFGLNRR